MRKLDKFARLLVLLPILGALIFTANSARAVTAQELLSQIASLRAQISAFQAKGMAFLNTVFTQDLTLGHKGKEVISLQQMLVAQGLLTMPAGVGFGYFGPLTQAAVAKWQASNGVSPTTGFWGPKSRNKQNLIKGVNNSGSGRGGSSSGGGGGSSYATPSTPIPPPAPTSTPQTPYTTPYATPYTTPAPSYPTPAQSSSQYPLHTNITAAVFWVGEPVGNGSSEDNALSAWDDDWQDNYGGFDDYSYIRTAANNYFPTGFTPKENPFYLDLPYNDFNNNGSPKSNRKTVVPWANEKNWGNQESMMKNRWVKLSRNGVVCYGQIEDAGPYQYDDYNYVFSTTDARPKSTTANNAGMDVSPALRDCLKFSGVNNVSNKVDWQFVNSTDVPNGPWKVIVTTSGINWP